MKRQDYLARTEGFIRPFLDKNGYILIKSEMVEEDHNWYLRLYIDLTDDEKAKRAMEHVPEDGGLSAAEAEVQQILDDIDPERASEREEYIPAVSINDCARVSRHLGKWLDKEDFIAEAYTLEVCSRGFLEDIG